jgi:uncharacterized protein
MKSKFISDEGGRTLAVVFDKGEEVAVGLLKIARENNLTAASFTAIGALSDVRLGYFDRERKDYKKIPIKEQVEVLALTGNIALSDGQSKVHAHLVIGKSNGTACQQLQPSLVTIEQLRWHSSAQQQRNIPSGTYQRPFTEAKYVAGSK